MNKITKIVEFLNQHLEDNNPQVIHWLNLYIHSSCRYSKRNWDGSWLSSQPAWPEKEVKEYYYYSNSSMNYAHHTNRFLLTFTDNSQYDISIYKFKRFLRREKYDYSFDRKL